MLPIGGSSSHETSECQSSPLIRLELASAWIGKISGCPSGPGRVGMNMQFTEIAAEPFVGFHVQRLIAKKQNLVLRQRLMQLLDLTVAERLRQRNASDIGADAGVTGVTLMDSTLIA